MSFRGSVTRLSEAKPAMESIARINAELERVDIPHLLTEKTIEGCWSRACQAKEDGPGRFLLLARLAEAALICAGNYADNCEYQAAGDLLVNPREILVHEMDDGRCTIKNRHGRLSTQFGLAGIDSRDAMKRFSERTCLRITKPALLPHMTRVLSESKRISPVFLEHLLQGQRRIADTLTFLAAWLISDSTELWQRLQASSMWQREFAEFQLCRFDAQVFHKIGADLRRTLVDPGYRSTFLTGSRVDENALKRSCPVALPAIAP